MMVIMREAIKGQCNVRLGGGGGGGVQQRTAGCFFFFIGKI